MTQRTLVLLRHAKAEPFAGSDAERPLAVRGRQQAMTVGEELQATGVRLDAALVSTAVRTRQTWDLLSSRLVDAPEPELLEDLYDATARTALALVQGIDPSVRTAIVVGHEPVMSTLAALLADADSPAAAQVRVGVPTAARCVLTFSGEWAGLDKGGARLERVERPQE